MLCITQGFTLGIKGLIFVFLFVSHASRVQCYISSSGHYLRQHPCLIFQAAGIAVMAVGIFARVSASDYTALTGEGGFQSAANIMIAAGALVMLIGIVGCCGAIRENKWLLLLVSSAYNSNNKSSNISVGVCGPFYTSPT